MAEKFLTIEGVRRLWDGMKNYIDKSLNTTQDFWFDKTEYIESSGGAWIDTGLALDDRLEFEIEASIPAFGHIAALVTGHYDKNNRQGFIVFNTDSHKIDYYWCGVGYKTLKDSLNEIDFSQKFKITQNSQKISITQGEKTLEASYQSSGSISSGSKTIHLLHSDNESHSTYTTGRIYSVKIKDRVLNNLYLDGIPVIMRPSGEVGLLDKVNMRFMRSTGPAQFSHGSLTA